MLDYFENIEIDKFMNYDYINQLLCNDNTTDTAVNATSEKDCINLTKFLDYYYDYNSPAEYFSEPEKIIVPLLFSLTFTFGVVGNGLVVYVVLRNGAMKTVTNLYLVNLSLADLLFLIICVPFTAATYIIPSWPFGEPMCKAVNYAMVVTMAVSVLTLTAMGIDRYYAVAMPVLSRTYRTIDRTRIVMGSIWFLSITTLLPVIFIPKVISYWDHGSEQDFCIEYFENTTHRRAYTVSLFFFFYLIPLSIIGVCYFLMAKSLWSRVTPGTSQNGAKGLRSRRKIAKLVLVVVTVFGICWLPVHCVHLLNDFGDPHLSFEYYMIKIVAHVLSYLNSAVNPIIYSFMSESFRKCLREAFKCISPKNKKIGGVVNQGVEHRPSPTLNNQPQAKPCPQPRLCTQEQDPDACKVQLYKEVVAQLATPPGEMDEKTEAIML